MQHKNINTARYFHRVPWRTRQGLYVLLCCLLFNTLPSHAGTFLLVNSGDSEIYRRFEQNLDHYLKSSTPGDALESTSLDNFNANINTFTAIKYNAIISAGIEASIAISSIDNPSTRVMAMLPEHSFQQLSKSGEIVCKAPSCHVILLDQPIKRQLRLLKLALPDRTHIALIGSEYSSARIKQIRAIANDYGLVINSFRADNESELISILTQGLSDSDVLMATPDPVVYNRNTARAVLLATFNQRIPVFAYSRSFVLAGATLGIYTTPKQIAKHVADLLSRPHDLNRLPQVLYPKYFSIEINERAAESLNINMPDASFLTERLNAYEKQ